ncbi:uncharacterized protein LOC111701320 isoform X2 [Eurytemora carolleeae]|uniref:uncharacterized protein LOC111701320 isoform X2 n=1 Tax=Eurytemora carolleeae TaxID=1294199 RepID=UPI000C779778|nr:uncharacterized protein LOC111701320 isoform X2 [Eurytemora carolleeae]|eukprot:XP_023328322.1 uncharacterized protein LOC111701320 isoform X2 [Eurytemora affinis]
MRGLGKIHFSVKYENNKLDVRILECQGLKDADFIGKSDPYVQLYILPGNHPQLKTKTINNNLNPVFNQAFSFSLTKTQVLAKTVVFQVFDSDLGKDKPLGEARFALRDMEGKQNADINYWIELTPITNMPPVLRHRASVVSNVVSRESSVTKKVSNVSSFHPTVQTETRSYSSTSSEHGRTSLRELNSRLENVVAQNRKFEDVDTKLIINLLSKKVHAQMNSDVVLTKMEHHIQPLRDEYKILAELNAEIEILKRENDVLNTRTHEIKERLMGRTEKEEGLMITVRDMEGKLHQMQLERDTVETRKQTYELHLEEARGQLNAVLNQLKALRLDQGRWEGELTLVNEKFNLCGLERQRMMSSYSAEFESEIECPTIYWDIVNDYTKKMDDEVASLREMYLSYNNEIKGLEGREIARLSTSMHDVGSNYGDVSGVIGELEIVKKRMLELEMDKLTIRQKIFEIRFALDQEEALFHAQVSTGCTRGQYRVYQRSVQGIPEVSTGCTRGQYRLYQRSVQGVPEVSKGCTRGQ